MRGEIGTKPSCRRLCCWTFAAAAAEAALRIRADLILCAGYSSRRDSSNGGFRPSRAGSARSLAESGTSFPQRRAECPCCLAAPQPQRQQTCAGMSAAASAVAVSTRVSRRARAPRGPTLARGARLQVTHGRTVAQAAGLARSGRTRRRTCASVGPDAPPTPL